MSIAVGVTSILVMFSDDVVVVVAGDFNTVVKLVVSVVVSDGFVVDGIVKFVINTVSLIGMLIVVVVALGVAVVNTPLVVSLKTVGVVPGAVDREVIVLLSATVLFAGGGSVVEGMGIASVVDFSDVMTADFVDASDFGTDVEPAEIVTLVLVVAAGVDIDNVVSFIAVAVARIAGVVEIGTGVVTVCVTSAVVLDVGDVVDEIVIFSGWAVVSFRGAGTVVAGIETAVLVAGSAVALYSNIAEDILAVGCTDVADVSAVTVGCVAFLSSK